MQRKTAAIVVIGNEILTGKSADKNASFLIGELYDLGVALRLIVVIPDDLDEISRTVRECSDKFDYVFTSGGVGPTHDDLTIEGIARAFARPVVRHPELEAMIRGYFGEAADETRLRMADAPADSELIHSTDLRWPVLSVRNVYVLPGVPELFRRKFESIRERFRAEPFFVRAVYTREDEFDIAARLDRVAAAYPDVDVGSYPTFSNDEYRVKITLESKMEPAVDEACTALLGVLDPASVVKRE
jgi:molybdenum cofactor synthesis domain-containing protein